MNPSGRKQPVDEQVSASESNSRRRSPPCLTRRRCAPCAFARSRKTCRNREACVHGSLRPSAFRTSRTGWFNLRPWWVFYAYAHALARALAHAHARAHTHTNTEAAAVECAQGVCESAVPCHACRWACCARLLHLLRLPGSTCVVCARICNGIEREGGGGERARWCRIDEWIWIYKLFKL